MRLLRIFFGRRLWPSLCGGLLLTISPSPAYRLAGHFALANHWLILAAFCLYFSWQRGAIKSVELNNRGAELESRGAVKAHSKSRAAARLQMQHVGIQVNLAVARLKLGNWARHRYRRAEDHVHAGGVGEVRLSQHHRARPPHPPRSRHDRNHGDGCAARRDRATRGELRRQISREETFGEILRSHFKQIVRLVD